MAGGTMGLNETKKYLWVALLALALAGFCVAGAVGAENRTAKTPLPAKPIPLVVDVGAKKCIPCKMMAPILEELRKEYEGVFRVEFIDVWENPGAGEKYGVRGIPTQIFYDASGKEFYRHMGYFSKEQILDTFRKHGVVLKKVPERT
jgi:thioredoxin 1